MSKRVLIADDVAELRQLLRRVIERAGGFKVVAEAADGEQALRKARDLAPDVVLLDVNMPVKSGLDVLPEIRRALPDATIVIFSGFDSGRIAEPAARLGADACLEKGTPAPELVDRLRTVISLRTG